MFATIYVDVSNSRSAWITSGLLPNFLGAPPVQEHQRARSTAIGIV